MASSEMKTLHLNRARTPKYKYERDLRLLGELCILRISL